MPRPIIATFAMTVSLAACAQTPAPVAAAPAAVVDATSPAHCDAGKATPAIGRLPDPDIQEQARTAAGAEVVRVLRHNQPITKEYRVGRLNLVLDTEGRIASAHCG